MKIKNMRKLLTKIINNCIKCNTEKKHQANYGIPKCEQKVKTINEVIAIDIKGPIKANHFDETDFEKDFYILVVVDVFSRFTEVGIIFEIDSETVCKEQKRIWLRTHPTPKLCLTDNGRKFTSHNFKVLLDSFNIKHVTSAPYNPTGNGIVERINKEIGIVLRMSRKARLSELKKNLWRKLNCTVNLNTKHTPYEIYTGKSIFKNLKLYINVNKNEIFENTKKRLAAYQNRLDKIRVKIKYRKGDLVYIKNNSPDKVNPSGKYCLP
ncbi:Gag-Pro-Pol polyprotein [Dictyocoela muelleri]|nr:Gag-Pro-Pol polyprotein [Dictyocoela muelleri]